MCVSAHSPDQLVFCCRKQGFDSLITDITDAACREEVCVCTCMYIKRYKGRLGGTVSFKE